MPRGENMKKVIAVLCFVLVALAASQAGATTLTYAITSDHCSGGCASAGNTIFGYVVLTNDGQAANTVLVTVTLQNANEFVVTGIPNGIAGTGAFSLTSNPTITESAFSTNFGAGFLGSTGYSQHMDGAGDFMYTVSCPDCGHGGGGGVSGPMSFIVGATGITPYTFIANPDDDNNLFAFDILSGTTHNTGVVDVSTAPVVPDGGATAALLGLAMVGLGFVRRFRR
jgi:VPDSG-CTERM motif